MLLLPIHLSLNHGDAFWLCFLWVTRPDSAVLHLDVTTGCCGSWLGAHPVLKLPFFLPESSFQGYQFLDTACPVAAQVLMLT